MPLSFPTRSKGLLLLYAAHAVVGVWLLWLGRSLAAMWVGNLLFLSYYAVPLVAGVVGMWMVWRGKRSWVVLLIATAYALYLAGGEALEHGRLIPRQPVLVVLEILGVLSVLVLVGQWAGRPRPGNPPVAPHPGPG